MSSRRWAWLQGHIFQMDHHSNPRIAITWVPEGKRKRGQPRETWRQTVERELRERGLRTWTEAATAALDRATWREREGAALFSLRKQRNNDDESDYSLNFQFPLSTFIRVKWMLVIMLLVRNVFDCVSKF